MAGDTPATDSPPARGSSAHHGLKPGEKSRAASQVRPGHLPTPGPGHVRLTGVGPFHRLQLHCKHRDRPGRTSLGKPTGEAPLKAKPQRGPAMVRDAAKASRRQHPPGPEKARGRGRRRRVPGAGGGTRSPSSHRSPLSHPSARRGPTLARCGPPVGTEFIFLTSCDNTWLCLFNFLLWMGQENQFGSLRSKHSSPHIMRGHPRRRRSPYAIRKNTSGSLLAGAGLGALGTLLRGSTGQAGLLHTPQAPRPGPGSSGPLSLSPHEAEGPRGGCRWHRRGAQGVEAKFTPRSPAPRS